MKNRFTDNIQECLDAQIIIHSKKKILTQDFLDLHKSITSFYSPLYLDILNRYDLKTYSQLKNYFYANNLDIYDANELGNYKNLCLLDTHLYQNTYYIKRTDLPLLKKDSVYKKMVSTISVFKTISSINPNLKSFIGKLITLNSNSSFQSFFKRYPEASPPSFLNLEVFE